MVGSCGLKLDGAPSCRLISPLLPHGFSFSISLTRLQYVEDGRERVTIDFLECLEPPKGIFDLSSQRVEMSFISRLSSLKASPWNRACLLPVTEDNCNWQHSQGHCLLQARQKKHGDGSPVEPIIGNPQRDKLPFICEEKIVAWEIQVFDNDDTEFID
jgi:hypothetical protein